MRGMYMPRGVVALLGTSIGPVELYLATPGAWIETRRRNRGSVTNAVYPSAKGSRIYASARA